MTREELEELLQDTLPGFELRKDRKGQLVIYTGHYEDDFGDIISMDEDMDEEGELEDEDEDLVSLEEDDED